MRKPWETVKVKILLGYLFLIGIAAFTVWLIYSEILVFQDNKTRINQLNNKILYFNSILTNLYQAETLERTYSQTGNREDFANYDQLIEKICLQFDTLSKLSVVNREKLHTDSIVILLNKKRQNLKEISLLKQTGSSDDIYERAIDRFAFDRDSLNTLLDVRRIVTTRSESTYVEQKKKKFLERLAYAFNPKNNKDSVLKINKNHQVATDSMVAEFNPADSVIHYLNDILGDIRMESEASQRQLENKEREILASDRTITLRLREMITIFEKEIFVGSLDELRALQDRIRLTTGYLIALGVLALIVISIFLILILKDLTQSQRYRQELEKAKALSDSLLKSKEQFMLSITHDIKSPIASVTGYARLMYESTDKKQRSQYLENINKSAGHVLKLISDLVDLTRLETGKLKIEPEPVNLKSFTEDMFSAFYPMAETKGLHLTLAFNVSPGAVYQIDPLRLKQILGNILSNAIKYTSKGKVELEVSLESSSETADHIRFDINDTGIGISKEDSELIFHEFSQVADRERYEGVGLGLSIAQRLVNLIGGKITMDSEVGKGSRFTVHLPFHRSSIPIPEKTVPPNVIIEKNSIKILVIDDDEIFLNLTTETLRNAGMIVFDCISPTRAIEVLNHHEVDLIITDMQMPVMKGTEFLTYIQRRTGKLIPVIVLSGSDTPEDYQNIKAAAWVQKPFTPDLLLETISAALQRKHTGQKTYNLKQIRQFALDDPQSLRRILVSFVESSHENLRMFNRHIIDKDRRSLSELAHKMLAMFRQLEAEGIVRQLLKLERESENLSAAEWMRLSTDTFKRIEDFIEVFSEEQGIYMGTR